MTQPRAKSNDNAKSNAIAKKSAFAVQKLPEADAEGSEDSCRCGFNHSQFGRPALREARDSKQITA